MKLPHYSDQKTMVYDITKYLHEKINLTPEQAVLLRFCLEDNILMTIEIDEKVYRTPWKYYRAFIEAFDTCCRTCNEETLFEVERSKTELINHSQRLSDHANKF
jgi:hypothetical protein